MRKLFIITSLLATFICTFSSCNKPDDDGGGTQMGIILLTYESIMKQNTIALDPFNVALRFNALLVDSDGDYKNEEIKNKLLGENTNISYDETEGKYIISNNSNLSTDLKRTGQLEIITNGYATLQEPNAIWNLKTNTSSPYTIFYGNYDIIIEIPQANNSYMIQNTGDKWTINMRSVLSYPQAYSSDDDFKSYWTAIYTVVPDTFSGSAEVLKSTKFSISPDVTTSTTMYTTDVLNIMTSSPMRYNPICGTRAFAPGGSLIVSVAEATDPSGYFSVEWLENESGCKPTVALTFQGETQEFPGNM